MTLLLLLKVGISCRGRDLVYYLLMIDSFIVFSRPFHHTGWRETNKRNNIFCPTSGFYLGVANSFVSSNIASGVRKKTFVSLVKKIVKNIA